ncbi:hypothetical protein LTR53_004081, partial [Teratosphaeriaceae sp. CCFEE 6253]
TLRPLVAVLVHGPIEREDGGGDNRSKASLYQTTVEVYSLQTQKHVDTLYRSTTARMEEPVVGHLSLPPKPVGELSLDAAGKFITLSSGKSGEVFVFTSNVQAGDEALSFRCIAKYWTSLQTRQEAPRPPSANGNTTSESDLVSRIPLTSLSARWLAVVPPYTSPGSSVQGSPKLAEGIPQAYGIGTHAAPLQPPLTCEVAGIDVEGTLSWLSRKAAQGLVTASQRGYEMSVQGWKELTHPSPPSSHAKSNSESNIFPPTNAPADDPRRLAKEPALVSIVDLQKLLVAEEQKAKQAPPPLATFALVEGCNFVSFSSDGLRLLTSNRKGEASSLWDLGHVAHGSLAPSSDDEGAAESVPHVKLLHRIARSSPSVIVDSAWSRDGDWVALLTAHGTVHLHEVPLTASRKRRRRPTLSAAAAPDKAEASVSLSHGISPPSNGFLGGLRSWSQQLSTQVHTAKTTYGLPTTFAGFRETAAAARTAGQRAVSRGLAQGFTAAKGGVGDMWHAEDNKIRLKSLPEGAARRGGMRWVQKQGGASLALVVGGAAQIYPVQRVVRRKGDAVVSGLKRDKYAKNLVLPRISTARDGGAGGKASLCAKEGVHGFWSLRAATTGTEGGLGGRVVAAKAAGTHTNEVETNPAYCPFHVDPRVGIYAFEESAYASQVNLHEDAVRAVKRRGHGPATNEENVDSEPWLSGGPLPAGVKLNERARDEVPRPRGLLLPGLGMGDEGDGEDEEDDAAAMIESRLSLHPASEGEGGQEIRVQSRRARRGGGRRYAERGYGDGDVDVDVDDDDGDSLM